MGVQREDGYSADVEGFLLVGERRLRVAKTNGSAVVLVEPVELPPNCECELLSIVDGDKYSRRVTLPDGASLASARVNYRVVAPF